jgi:hypothetical protein
VKTDPQSHEVLARTRHPYKANLSADAAGFEAVWSAEGSYAPSVYKLDAQLKTPPVKISLGHSGWARRSVTHLAVGDHAVWATVDTPFTKVFRIDPDTLTIVAAIPGAGLVEAGEGAVWVSRGVHLVRIDPETNRITATIPLDMYQYAIATGGGAVWVANGPRVIRINPLTNKIEATFNVFWDATPANYFSVVQMAVVKETLWALVFRRSKRFSHPDRFGDYALVEIDIKTNAIRTIHKLGSGEEITGPQRFTVIDDAAWVCLPTGLYVIPIADTVHPESGK